MSTNQPNHSEAVHYASGRFEGRAIRGVLQELQAASLGRKSTGKDRRPIDPPPIAQLRLYDVIAGSVDNNVQEVDYGTLPDGGFICHCDLYRISQNMATDDPGTARLASHIPAPGASTPLSPSSSPESPTYDATHPSDVADLELCSSSKLLGSKVSNSISLSSALTPGIAFPFVDVSVSSPGIYKLRYRVFDLLSRDGADAIPTLAECFGAPFRIFSTHRFPGLPEQTKITEMMSVTGVKTARRSGNRRARGPRKSSKPKRNSARGRASEGGTDEGSSTHSSSHDEFRS